MLLVFTDLDGCLLDHNNYSIEAALPAIRVLRERGFPLVMNSSKTAAEIENLQAELDLSAPYVCENGAALNNIDPSIANDTNVIFGSFQSQWLPRLHALRESEEYRFEGFSDWSVQRVCELTDLQSEAASRAKCRQFSEPILWLDSESRKEEFVEQLKKMKLRLIEGGRFLSVQGNHDKSNAIQWLRDKYCSTEGVITVALGDSPNDGAMLNAADVAVVVKSPKSQNIEVRSPQTVIHTTQPGPSGWHEAMQEVMKLYDSGRLLTATTQSN